MSKIHKQRILDPKEQLQKFEDDLAKMNVGPKAATEAGSVPGADPAVRQRMLDKNFALNVAGFKFNSWSALLEESQTIEHALDPKFWSDQVGKIIGHNKAGGRGDIIEVRKLSTGLYAQLSIVEIAVGYVRVELIRGAEPSQAEVAEDCPLTTRWNAGAKTHEVIRKGDNAVLQGGFQTKNGAVAWLLDHINKMAA
jgi:hypothetical protein